eukprot:5160433-Alexandrium_andersonii.AAC.1
MQPRHPQSQTQPGPLPWRHPQKAPALATGAGPFRTGPHMFGGSPELLVRAPRNRAPGRLSGGIAS